MLVKPEPNKLYSSWWLCMALSPSCTQNQAMLTLSGALLINGWPKSMTLSMLAMMLLIQSLEIQSLLSCLLSAQSFKTRALAFASSGVARDTRKSCSYCSCFSPSLSPSLSLCFMHFSRTAMQNCFNASSYRLVSRTMLSLRAERYAWGGTNNRCEGTNNRCEGTYNRCGGT